MSQTWIEITGASSGVLGTWGPIIGPSISGVATLATGFFVIWYARKQARIAREKLSLDLFDRRFAAHRALLDAIEARQAEISDGQALDAQSPLGSRPKDQADREFSRRANDVRFLFGPEVWDIVLQMFANLVEQERANEAMYGPNDLGTQGFDAFWAWRVKMGALRRDFRVAIEPYMMLGHIAVNRPRRIRRDVTRPPGEPPRR